MSDSQQTAQLTVQHFDAENNLIGEQATSTVDVTPPAPQPKPEQLIFWGMKFIGKEGDGHAGVPAGDLTFEQTVIYFGESDAARAVEVERPDAIYAWDLPQVEGEQDADQEEEENDGDQHS